MERKSFLGPSPQVKLSFPEQKALAGSQVRLKVQAAPGSLCAIHIMYQPTSYYGLEAAYSSKVVSMEWPRCWTGAFSWGICRGLAAGIQGQWVLTARHISGDGSEDLVPRALPSTESGALHRVQGSTGQGLSHRIALRCFLGWQY